MNLTLRKLKETAEVSTLHKEVLRVFDEEFTAHYPPSALRGVRILSEDEFGPYVVLRVCEMCNVDFCALPGYRDISPYIRFDEELYIADTKLETPCFKVGEERYFVLGLNV